jgi:hypothetical protein
MAAKFRPVLIAIAVLVMASLACSLLSSKPKSGAATPTDASSSSSSSDQGSATLEPQPESTQAESSGADSTPSSGSSSDQSGGFSSLDEGLQGLDSYRMQFSLNVDGKDDQGQQKTGTFAILQEVNHKTNEQHARITGLDIFSTQTGTGGSWEVFKIQDATYMLTTDSSGTAACTMYADASQAPNDFEIYKPSDLLGSLENAKLTKKGVDVNGVKTDQYKADNTSLSFGVFTQGDASFWVAQQAQYVVKYTGQATGKAVGLFNVDGKVDWNYAVDQVNQLPALTLPPECEAKKPSTDIPIPDNATDKMVIDKMTTFNSPDTVSAVADFYRQALPKQGWTAGEENSVGSDMITLSYTKDTRSLSVMVTKGDKGATVILQETQQ